MGRIFINAIGTCEFDAEPKEKVLSSISFLEKYWDERRFDVLGMAITRLFKELKKSDMVDRIIVSDKYENK